MAVDDPAIGPDHVNRRQAGHSVRLGDLFSLEQESIAIPLLLHQLEWISLLPGVNTKDNHSLILISLMELLHARHHIFAGAAPSSPEVHDHYVPAIFRERMHLSF